MSREARDPVAAEATAIRFVCMPGAAYTGSTLLAFLLDGHPDVCSLGAAVGFNPRVEVESYRCSCGELFAGCPFWSALRDRLAARGADLRLDSGRWGTRFQVSRHRLVNIALVRSLRHPWANRGRDAIVSRLPGLRRRLAATAQANVELARAALEVSGARVFVDSSRDPQRVRLLAAAPGLEVFVVHVVKDARAGAASFMKHRGWLDARRAAAAWRRANLEAEEVRRHVPADRWLRVRYSDLCRRPQEILDGVAEFLGIPPSAVPESFFQGEHHILGNPMRLTGLGEIREDTSWRERLSAADLEIVAKIAGAANRAFGYDWP